MATTPACLPQTAGGARLSERKQAGKRRDESPAYLAMRKEMVAAIVADTETTAAPGPTPNSSPAVIVSGTAGRASTSRAVYKAPYAGYLQIVSQPGQTLM